MSRAVLRSVLELRTPVTRLPPTFLLPMRPARYFNSTAQIIKQAQPTDAGNPVAASQNRKPASPQPQTSSASAAAAATTATATTTQVPLPSTPASETSFAPSPSIQDLLPLLAAQPGGQYIRAHIHGFPYLVTTGDQVRLPFKMPGVVPGDVLRLNRASVLGSRDFTLRGSPYVDERLFECRAVVTGTESEPLRVKIKKKRRTRRSKRVESKHRYTILRISELKVSDGSDLEA